MLNWFNRLGQVWDSHMAQRSRWVGLREDSGEGGRAVSVETDFFDLAKRRHRAQDAP